MDECIPNLVVTENYVVQPVESIPISMVDFENVGIAHLLHTGHSVQTGQPVIRFTATNVSNKVAELHPLEAEIQRDLEMKQQFLRQQNSSLIHSVPECPTEGTVKKPNHLIQIQQKSVGTINESIAIEDEAIQFQQIIHKGTSNILRNNLIKSDQNALPHLFQTSRPMIVPGKQFIIVPENSPLLTSDWKSNKNPTAETLLKPESKELYPNNGPNEIPDTEIPLTVQNYNIFNSSLNDESNNSNKSKQDSDSEDEDVEIEPVCDYEPDPETTVPAAKDEEDAGKPNKCYMCFKSFRQKKNMYAHIRKIHSAQPKIEGGILCPLCKMHALRQEHLRNHFEKLHDVRIEKEEKLFNTMEEFLSWKEYIERETLSLYVSKSSAKLLANNQQKSYYKCHRSGNYITLKKENRKKKLKVQGSNKIGATCPAAMEVTENVHGVNVIFWKTHVGHDNDLAHLVLSKEDKARITECLNSGVPWDKILEKIKKEAEKSTNTPSRLTLVSKQDLRNIKKIYDMKACPELFPARKKVSQGRNPMKERMLRRASQSLVIEKADLLLNLLETTEVLPEFRPKVCLMIDNLISTVKRRAVKKIHKREKNHKKRRKKSNEIQIWTKSTNTDDKETEDIDDDKTVKEEEIAVAEKLKENTSDTVSECNITGPTIMKKRGRPKKHNSDSSNKARMVQKKEHGNFHLITI